MLNLTKETFVELPKYPSRLGEYVTTVFGNEKVRAFVPPPLPPVPPAELTDFQLLLEQANQSLGRLDGLASVLPGLPLLIYMYVRKEAVLSSQIEGTQSSLSDLLLFEDAEVPGVPLDDVQEVSNYVAAMEHGLRRIREGFPLSLRLIREIHEVLLSEGRGSDKTPGEFRISQNWIGGSRPANAHFVPPPPERVIDCLGALELFLHKDDPTLPLLVKAGLVHVQFETIHPFLDGNGRLGRLLITFLLCASQTLHEPILYLSLYFKTNREQYYKLLDRFRTHGDWESWLRFFLSGVKATADQGAETARQMLRLFETDRERIETLGRAAPLVHRVHAYLQKKPILSIPMAAAQLKISAPTMAKSIQHLQKLGLIRETTGRARHRQFVYFEYLALLNQDTEPLPPR